MKTWAINIVIFAALLVTCAAIRPTHTITEPDKAFQHQIVQQEIYKYLSRLRPQTGFGATNASGRDTIYLTEKYASASSYVIQATPVGYQNSVGIGAITDSSFEIYVIDYDGFGVAKSFHWQTIGVDQ